MSSRIPTSKIHLKRNSYQSSYGNNSTKYSSSRLLKTDRGHDSRTSFKGLEDTKYESSIMKRMLTESKQQEILKTPTQSNYSYAMEKQLRGSTYTPITKALTERRNGDTDYGRGIEMVGFHKKKSTDRSNKQVLRKGVSDRRASNVCATENRHYEINNDFAIKKYEQTESILTQKHKRTNDLQRFNKFLLKRAEELAEISDELTKKNTQLKAQLKHFEGVIERMMRLEQKCNQLQKRDQNDSVNYEAEKKQILTLTKMC